MRIYLHNDFDQNSVDLLALSIHKLKYNSAFFLFVRSYTLSIKPLYVMLFTAAVIGDWTKVSLPAVVNKPVHMDH